MARHLIHLFRKPALARRMGRLGRQRVVERWSLERMVTGYQELIHEIYSTKCDSGVHRASGGLCPTASER
jgi:hypothetical protein